MKIKSICNTCGITKIDVVTRKYCTRKCQWAGIQSKGQFKQGHMGFSGKDNGMWKGDRATYISIHQFMQYQYGRPMMCDMCGSKDKKRYEWANISGNYTRQLKDWKRLCTSCHRNYDGHGFKAWETRRKLYGQSGRKFGI